MGIHLLAQARPVLSPIWPDLIAHPMLTRTIIAAFSGGLCPLPKAAALLFWYGIAVLPCFSASGKVPVARCVLPLRDTYAVYVQFPLRLSHAAYRPRLRNSGAVFSRHCHSL